ncbi:DUF6105 family protein [Aureimonas pseudogalii]|uniref:Uncharacterized protein n=1 Tax=Aureimonas pseudogalii TaxID=1744844 RepID=A0A7W6MK22_9HYPH|nr:DUF6105 family protein [Aureimonas pseudogalii]MBB3998740.1 hypothetical protein [Aureimonas pseudogalii]
MRWLLGLWFAPISFLVAWFVLASHDWNLGTFFFSREMYDLVFAIYGKTLGVAPESLPPLVARALVLDSAIVLALYAFRRRKVIAGWLRSRTQVSRVAARRDRTLDSLSSAP